MRLRLREVREQLAVSQVELQRRTGMSRTTISSLENGKQNPHPSTVQKLAEALEIQPERLVDGAEEAQDILAAMIEAREARLQEAIDNDEIDLETAKSADDLFRDIVEVAVPRLLTGRERVGLALDGFKATVDAAYGVAVQKLTGRRASVGDIGERRKNHEGGSTEQETRIA